MSPATRLRALAVAVALLVLAGAAFTPALRAPLLFDDINSIEQNPSIRHLFPIGAAMRPPPALAVSGRPVVNLSLAASYALNRLFAGDAPGGIQASTLGHHVVNLALHLCCALLLFGVVRRTLLSQRYAPSLQPRATGIAVAITALWAVHPLQTEAVNYIVQRTELLASVFLLGTLYAWIRAWDAGDARRRVAWRVTAVIACALGMGSKEWMIVAPLLVVLYDRAFRLGSWRAVLSWSGDSGGRALFYMLLVLTSGWLIALLLGNPRADTVGFDHVPWHAYLLAQGWAIPHYVRLALMPIGLTVDYGEVLVGGWKAVAGLIGLALLFGLTIVGWRRAERWGWAAFLGSWFFLILAPSSSVIPIGTEIAAERRFYLPLVALIALVAVAVSSTTWRGRRAALLAGAVFVALGATTFERSRLYNDREALYREVIARVPKNVRAYGNLAAVIEQDRLRTEEAADLYRRALAIRPDYAFAQFHLASIYTNQGRFADAKPLLENLLARNPGEPQILGHLGLVIGAMGNVEGAIPLLERSAAARPDPQTLTDLGMMYAAAGRLPDAASALERALAIDPNRAPTHSYLGFVLIGLGRSRDAIPHLQRSLQTEPLSAITHARLALALADVGNRADAARAAAQASQLAGNEARVYALAGKAFRLAGFPNEAEAVYTRALQLNPNDDESRTALAALRGR